MSTVCTNDAAADATSRPSRRRDAADPAAVLDNLAARFRPGGLFLVHARHGRLASPTTTRRRGLFFQRYVLPHARSIPTAAAHGLGGRRHRRGARTPTRTRRGRGTPARRRAGGVPARREAPARRRHPARRQGQQLLASAKTSLRVCSRLGLDGIWLNQQAEELPDLRRRGDPPPGAAARSACSATRSASPAWSTSSTRSPASSPTPTKSSA